MSNIRLNVFLHFRKAGGTRIVNLASANGENLWEDHDNGKPCDPFGSVIDLPNMNEADATEFLDQAMEKGVSFISVAGGRDFIEAALNHGSVTTICSLRDPIKTCISNYNYDYYLANANDSTIQSYVHTRGYENPYIRSFYSGHDEFNLDIGEVDRVVNILSRFDLLIQLGHPDSDRSIEETLGWKNFDVKSHSTSGEDRLWKIFNLLRKGKILRAVSLVTGKKRGLSSDVPVESVRYDQMLMERLFG